jgi:hypothetical protein
MQENPGHIARYSAGVSGARNTDFVKMPQANPQTALSCAFTRGDFVRRSYTGSS